MKVKAKVAIGRCLSYIGQWDGDQSVQVYAENGTSGLFLDVHVGRLLSRSENEGRNLCKAFM